MEEIHVADVQRCDKDLIAVPFTLQERARNDLSYIENRKQLMNMQ